MNIITWKAYLKNSYYEYELTRNVQCEKCPFSVLSIIVQIPPKQVGS